MAITILIIIRNSQNRCAQMCTALFYRRMSAGDSDMKVTWDRLKCIEGVYRFLI